MIHNYDYNYTSKIIQDEPYKPESGPIIPLYSAAHLLDDSSEAPDDIISPRVLTPGGMMVFGGAPKIGKSDFLLSLLVHAAAGLPFLGMVPPRPLNVVYLQAEIGYHYLRERLKSIDIDPGSAGLVRQNLYCTPQLKTPLDEAGVIKLAKSINDRFVNCVDIIAVDPLRNFFDGSDENDNSQVLSFLQRRLERLRELTNPNAGIILVHHTKKATKGQLEDDQFQVLAGASCLRGFYSTGILMYQPDPDESCCKLFFELRHGKKLAPKYIDKVDGKWSEINNNFNA